MTTKPQRLFLDTCSCLHEKAPALLRDQLLPKATAGAVKIILPGRVKEEILKHGDGDKAGLKAAARSVWSVLAEGLQKGQVILAGEQGDQFADALFQSVFSRFRTEFPLALLTQDVGLMHDILQMAASKSVTLTHPIEVWTIDEREGKLRQVLMQEVERRLAGQEDRKAKLRSLTPEGSLHQPFEKPVGIITSSTPIPLEKDDLKVGGILTTGDGAALVLGAPVARGGEGAVFRTSQSGLLAKIYYPSTCTAEREAKLIRMIEHGLDPANSLTESICWPTTLLRDSQGRFRGYLMKEGRGEILYNAVLVGTNLRSRFPKWDRADLVRLCITVLQRIRYLHSLNILIGDINPANILVQSPEEVYFLDTDSYQVEGWLCPVGTSHFTAPELQGRRFAETRRTKEQERFAVATLLFMILHAGKQPYAQMGSTDPVTNIKGGKFPYCLGSRGYQGAPEGPWKYIWSNLSHKVKDAFFRSFAAEYAHARRVKLDDWLDLMSKYLYHLENHCEPGHIERQLFPRGKKPLSLHARMTFGLEGASTWAN